MTANKPIASIHVVGRIFGEDILGGDKRVSRGRSLGYLPPIQHLHRQRQNFIAITVDIICHRTEYNAAAIVGIDLLLIACTAVNAVVQALADNDTIPKARCGSLDTLPTQSIKRSRQFMS